MAGTILLNVKQIKKIIEISLVCECDAGAATFSPVALNSLPGMIDILGSKLYMIKAWPGTTAPKDACDLTITDVDGVDLLGARGVDILDATTKTSCSAGTVGTAMPIPITSAITVNITGNDVNAAIIHLRLLFLID